MRKELQRAVLGVLLLALVLPLWAQQQSSAGRYDQQIQQQVTQMLQKQDKYKNIRAQTQDAIVTIEGQVPVYIDRQNLRKDVRQIDHVQGVRDLVQVSSTMPDQELERKLADKLRYDRIGYGIMFNSLDLKVQNGVVTIGGQVHDYPDAASAVAIVETQPGVKDVIDNIKVLPTSNFDDELRIRLARAIYGAPGLRKYALDPQAPIRIVVDNGHVTLDGVVDVPMDKQIAEMQARSVPGVFSVKDNLVVASQQAKK
jgi:hyperosmotically inducible protein